MGRTRAHTRRAAHTYPRGVLDVRPEGYAFVVTSEGEFFIPEAKTGAAFNGDLVEISPLPQTTPKRSRKGKTNGSNGDDCSGERPSALKRDRAARVVRVLDRAFDTLVGRYEVAEPFGVVVPEDSRLRHDVFTMRADNPDIPDGSLVRVRITTFPGKGTAATGVIEEVLGDWDDAGILVDLIVARHKLETEFSAEVLAEAAASTLDVDAAFREGYRDIRDRFVFTIDPEDAKDFDDAVSLEPADGHIVRPDGAPLPPGAYWRLGVHIADVSRYVEWGSFLDLAARRRATSVYLVDRVIPMLPERLSNDLCSLRPNEDRLAMTVDLFLSKEGSYLDADFYPSVIRSKARLTYQEAQAILDGGTSDLPQLPDRLVGLSRIAKQRAALRRRKGGIDLDTAEAKVKLDISGRPVSIEMRIKTEATSLIEESMILANEAVAASLASTSYPCIYRDHDEPDLDVLEGLLPVISEFPWADDINPVALVSGSPQALAAVVESARGRAESDLISNLVLRSMKKAVYRPRNTGHYGLASEAYAHFTSPIRRYPDLVVHRMLKARAQAARGEQTPQFAAQREALGWISEHSSEMERIAQACARESQECKMIEYLGGFIGSRFTGVISGVATYGLYVRLENTAEGLIEIRNLGDEYFSYDGDSHALTGQDSGVTYRLGMPLEIVLVAADPRSRSLSFRLA